MTSPKPITYEGETYLSISALARHLGLTRQGMQKRVQRGRLVPTPKEKPYTADGTTYPSQQAAAHALGLHPTTISKRKTRKTNHCEAIPNHL